MYDEEYRQAISHFEHVLHAADEIDDPDLVAFALGAIARAHTKLGAYKEAEKFVDRAIYEVHRLGRKETEAVLLVRKAWIVFQRHKSAEAERLYARAESALRRAGDHLSLGDIRSAMGRIARRKGEYCKAIASYAKALRSYRKCGFHPRHRNFARALTNIALLGRLISKRISSAPTNSSANASEQTRQSIRRLRLKAFGRLHRAGAIFEREQDYRGRGSVLLIAAWLHTDSDELEAATLDLTLAHSLGEKKKDYILMARARMQQSIVENTMAERAQNPTCAYTHAEQALSFAANANELAERNTQNIRLMALTLAWRGIALMNPHFSDLTQALRCYQRADALLKPCEPDVCFMNPNDLDYVWGDLQLLKRKLEDVGCDVLQSEDSEYPFKDPDLIAGG